MSDVAQVSVSVRRDKQSGEIRKVRALVIQPTICFVCCNDLSDDVPVVDTFVCHCFATTGISDVSQLKLSDVLPELVNSDASPQTIKLDRSTRRICCACLDKSVLLAAASVRSFFVSGGECGFFCPLCLPETRMRVAWTDLEKAVSAETYELVVAGAVAFKEISMPYMYCPVTGCSTKQLFSRLVKHTIVCEKHGKRCTRCHEDASDKEHVFECAGLPRALLHASLSDGDVLGKARHCPHCRVLIVKHGGCNEMVCARCHRGFRWPEAYSVTRRRRRHHRNESVSTTN